MCAHAFTWGCQYQHHHLRCWFGLQSSRLHMSESPLLLLRMQIHVPLLIKLLWKMRQTNKKCGRQNISICTPVQRNNKGLRDEALVHSTHTCVHACSQPRAAAYGQSFFLVQGNVVCRRSMRCVEGASCMVPSKRKYHDQP